MSIKNYTDKTWTELMSQGEFLRNLTHINRFSGVELIKSESVSDHIWEMISLALIIVPKMNHSLMMAGSLSELIDLEKVIYLIAIHDLDESLYCDIPKPFKYHNPEVYKAINDTVGMLMEDNLTDTLVDSINESKCWTKGRENIIVSLLDTVQVGNKIARELVLGNYFMKSQMGNVLEFIPELISKLKNVEHSDTFKNLAISLMEDSVTYYNNILESRK